MKLRKNNLIDLYRRFIGYISSNYPDALIVDNDTNVVITYPGEMGRILILQDKSETCLIVKILLELGQKMTNNNTITFYLSTIDELNCLKSGAQVAMQMVNTSGAETEQLITKASTGQGYLTDANQNLIGVVDLSMIPTNAFIRNTDIAVQEEAKEITYEQPPQEKTIRKFFKR